MKNIVVYISILLLFSSAFSTWLYKQEKEERKRLGANQAALLEDVKRYKTKDSLNVVSIQKLTLTNKEFEQYNAELADRVKELGIKVKRLQSVSSTGTSTRTEIKTEVKDSIIFRDKERLVMDTMKCIKYLSPYLSMQGCVNKGMFEGLIESRDTIDQVVHRVPRKFLFLRYGTKGIRQEIYSRNPHTVIDYSTYIELK